MINTYNTTKISNTTKQHAVTRESYTALQTHTHTKKTWLIPTQQQDLSLVTN